MRAWRDFFPKTFFFFLKKALPTPNFCSVVDYIVEDTMTDHDSLPFNQTWMLLHIVPTLPVVCVGKNDWSALKYLYMYSYSLAFELCCDTAT